MVFAVLLLIPLAVAVLGFVFLDGITWKEFMAQVGAQVVVAGVSALIVSCANTYDTEVWNGTVTSKQQSIVPCSHSYQCSEECDTCYEHFNDWDWDVFTSNSETITIDRIDRQGRDTPPRWEAVKLGEPTSLTHAYTNYIKASPDSLFRHQGLVEKYRKQIPEYPQEVYDYYRLNRLVEVGLNAGDEQVWNQKLSEINGRIGAQKQVNMIVVLVHDLPQEYFYALEEAWIGGKKNDVVLVVDLDEDAGGHIIPVWANVMAWTSAEIFKVKLRDDAMSAANIDAAAITGMMESDVSQYYVRQPMHDFEYLKASIVPSTTEWIVSLVVGLLVAAGLMYWFQTENVFDGEAPSWLESLRGSFRYPFSRHPFRYRRRKRTR